MHPETTSPPRVPPTLIPSPLLQRLSELGGRPLNLYQILAHQPDLLRGWIEFAFTLRSTCQTPRSVRELMILRGAQLCHSAYEWQQHVPMARASGVEMAKIESLSDWKNSPLYTDPERVALALMESLQEGTLTDEAFSSLRKYYTDAEVIELVLTGSFYAMVPRVLDALRVPLENNS